MRMWKRVNKKGKRSEKKGSPLVRKLRKEREEGEPLQEGMMIERKKSKGEDERVMNCNPLDKMMIR